MTGGEPVAGALSKTGNWGCLNPQGRRAPWLPRRQCRTQDRIAPRRQRLRHLSRAPGNRSMSSSASNASAETRFGVLDSETLESVIPPLLKMGMTLPLSDRPSASWTIAGLISSCNDPVGTVPLGVSVTVIADER